MDNGVYMCYLWKFVLCVFDVHVNMPNIQVHVHRNVFPENIQFFSPTKTNYIYMYSNFL